MVKQKDKTVEDEVLEVEKEAETVKVEPVKVVFSLRQLASRQLAHEIKVANFLAGGKF